MLDYNAAMVRRILMVAEVRRIDTESPISTKRKREMYILMRGMGDRWIETKRKKKREDENGIVTCTYYESYYILSNRKS